MPPTRALAAPALGGEGSLSFSVASSAARTPKFSWASFQPWSGHCQGLSRHRSFCFLVGTSAQRDTEMAALFIPFSLFFVFNSRINFNTGAAPRYSCLLGAY